MKKSIFLILIAIISINIFAQNPRQRNYFKQPAPVISNEYKISFKDIVSKAEYLKMAITTQNLLEDCYLMYKQSETKFIFPFGEYPAKPRTVYIAPKEQRKKTLKVDGDTRFLVDSFTIHLDGVYKLPLKGNNIKIKDFELPASTNKIKTDKFVINLIKLKKSTAETYALFECTYLGDKIAMIDPSEISVKVEDKDIVYANDNKKPKIKFLRKGEKTKVKAIFHIPGNIVDMQFATLLVKWNDTFKEITPEKLDAVDIKFVLDKGKTAAKN